MTYERLRTHAGCSVPHLAQLQDSGRLQTVAGRSVHLSGSGADGTAAMAAKLIVEGKTYSEIIEQTGISSATLSRVSRAVHRGPGGYVRMLPKD